MAVTATFDTLEFVEQLKSAGFDDVQAKGVVTALKKIQNTQLDQLATKGDLRELKLELMAEIKLNRWMLALVVAATVLPALKTLFG